MNKKIRNATQCGIFKSKSELMVYNLLKEAGFNPEYEACTYTLWEGFKPSIPFWTSNKKNVLALNKSALRSITYTPDFEFEYNGYHIIIEVKGFPNDVFPYKFKMFRKKMESISSESENKIIIALIHNMKETKAFIEVIKALDITQKYEKSITL